MPDVSVDGDAEEVAFKIANLPLYLSGQLDDPSGMVKEALTAVGLVTLGNIHDHFDRLSQGMPGHDGTVWPQLAIVTLALRQKDTSAQAIARLIDDLTGKNGLVPKNRRRMFLNNAKRLRRFYEGGSPKSARRRALRLLEKMKPYISKTRYNKTRNELTQIGTGKVKRKSLNRLILAAASALMLRNTNDLFNSLEPILGALAQVFKIGPGWVEVGTQKDYAKYHQSPEPRKLKADGTPILPRRPFIPDIIPDLWYDDAVNALTEILGSADWMLKFLQATR